MDLAKVEEIVNRYNRQGHFLIPVLQDIQLSYNYLPPESLPLVAQRLSVPLTQVYSVATFYAAFSLKPRGKLILIVCDGTACHVKGSARLLDTVREELGIEPGDTTPDGVFTLEVVNCVGACAVAPVLVLNGEYHERMTPDALRRLISHVREEVVAEAK